MTDTSAPISQADAGKRIDELARIILAYSDVTERLQQSHEQLKQRVVDLQTELGEKSRQLEQKKRLAALGEMAAGIAHEVRNPLGAIKLYASLLQQDLAEQPQSLQTAQKISSAAQRVETIVSQVLYFTREIQSNPARSDLVEIVRDAIEMARTRASDRPIAFVTSGPDVLPANVDAHLLSQALVNLLVNAVEACGGDGHVFVHYDRLILPASAGTKIRISVRDTGPGISPDVIDRIFHPFFTTKDHGTGLGLAIVHRIIEAHDGTINAKNHPQGGAIFEVTL